MIFKLAYADGSYWVVLIEGHDLTYAGHSIVVRQNHVRISNWDKTPAKVKLVLLWILKPE